MTQKEIKKELDELLDNYEKLNIRLFELKNEGQITDSLFKKYWNKISKVQKLKDKIEKMKETEIKALDDYDYVFGIDEVGRGPLCGNVVTCCCMMKKESRVIYVDDSKKLSEKRREEIFNELIAESLICEIGEDTPNEIDSRNILDATMDAMAKAYNKAKAHCEEGSKILVLIDGNRKNPYIDADQIAVVKGDQKIYSIACASIIAKVTRDRQIKEIADKYPEYDLENNKGYGTLKHMSAIRKYGAIENFHRKTFLKNIK